MTTPLWLRQAGRAINGNSSTILSGASVAGVIATAVLASKASRRVPERLDGLETTRREKIEACWTLYIPAAISGAATIACIVGANQIGLRRNAALLGAYTLADTAFREYKEEVLEQLGAAKERKVTDKIAEKQIAEHPVSDAQVIITGGGDQLCYESLTGRYFKSDIEKIRQSENEINRRMVGGDMYASLNEFWALVGLASTTIGEELGFNLDNFVTLVFSSHLADDGRPCLAVGYTKLPIKDYGKF